MPRKRLLLFLRVAISLALILWLFWTIDLSQLIDSLSNANLTYLALAAIVMNLDRLLMASKWQLLLYACGQRLDLVYIVKIYYAATFGNLLLPTVGADAYRIVAVSRRTHATEDVFASVLVERVLGMMATCLVAVAGTIVFVVQRNESAGLRYAIILASASLLSFVLVGVSYLDWFAVVSTRLTAARSRLLRKLGELMAAYARFSKYRRTLVLFLVLSIVEQASAILSAFLVSRALGFGIPFTYFLIFVPIIESSIKLPIPASIAGFGLSEGLYVFLFGTVGVEAAAALSVGFITHAMFWVSILPVFLVLYWTGERLSMWVSSEVSETRA